jgi:glyoxylase-like metal-dependent hydrolase (beta-lactamase superfamily II)
MDSRSLGMLIAFALAAAAHAQQQDFSKVEIQTTVLAPGIAMLEGAGGNIAVSTGEDGPVIVDDQFAPLAPKIKAAVKALQDAPIRFVINTHHHFDHTGGNEAFGGAGALIVAHDNVRVVLSREQSSALTPSFKLPPHPKAALPVVTFADGVTLHWNGETIRVQHVANAHTNGDAHVWFTQANVVHMGDTFVNGKFPIADAENGGSIEGLIASANRVLAAATPETRIIPGHGPLATPADLKKFRDMLVDVRSRVEAGIASSKSMEEFVASKPLADLDAAWGGGFLTTDQLLTLYWMSMSAK